MTRRHEKVDAYISGRPEMVVPLLTRLRAFIHDTLPGTTESMQYGVPVFLNAHGVPVIYLFGSKKHVNFGFLKSAELADPAQILKGSGNPSKHIRIKPGDEVDTATLTRFIEQCKGLRT